MVVGCVDFLFATECVGMMRKLLFFLPSVRLSTDVCLVMWAARKQNVSICVNLILYEYELYCSYNLPVEKFHFS